MTSIKIFRNKSGKIVKYKITGHTGYDSEGSDIVCAAISSIAETAALGIIKYLGIKAKYTINKGDFILQLPKDAEDNDKKDTVIETMLLGLKEIEKQYSNYVNIVELEV